jgi:RHS repeat-associated protein
VLILARLFAIYFRYFLHQQMELYYSHSNKHFAKGYYLPDISNSLKYCNSDTNEHNGCYRYSFNGKEKDSEGMGGGQSTYDYGFRIYNPAIARFLSVDPLTKTFPWYTPYQFAGNKPIRYIDLDGLETANPEMFQIPNSPDDLDPNYWTLNEKHKNPKNPGSKQWVGKNGEKLTFDPAVEDADGWEGKDHWHYSRNKKRLDADGNPLPGSGKQSKSHLKPGQKTKFKIPTKTSVLRNIGRTLSVATLLLDIFSKDPHSAGMLYMRGAEKNVLYYDPESNTYFEITKAQVFRDKNGDKTITVVQYDYYSDYEYDKEKKGYVGVDYLGTKSESYDHRKNSRKNDKT